MNATELKTGTAAEGGHCSNGGCTRPVYRGKYCLRCWAGVKWTSIVQRVENKNGNNPSYVGVPIGFTRRGLIDWVLHNQPPTDMEQPSIDRIVPSKGYSPGNIRWIEKRKNSAGRQRDIQDGYKLCPQCERILPLNKEFFGINMGVRYGAKFQTYCKECRREYNRQWWREKHNNGVSVGI